MISSNLAIQAPTIPACSITPVIDKGYSFIISRVHTYANGIIEGFQVNHKTPRKIALGIITFIASVPLVATLESVLFRALNKVAGVIQNHNSSILLKYSLGNPILKAITTAYIAVVGPIFEELLCRNEWQSALKARFDKLSIPPFFRQLFTIITSSVLFALLRLSPFQNLTTNVIALAVTFVIGLILAGLKEVTGDLWAPATYHIAYSSSAIMHLWNKSPLAQ